MTVFVALLRAVNVGGTGKLAMSQLKAMCDGAGFVHAQTYLASGNVVFETDLAETEVKSRLEAAVRDHVGKPVSVLVRSLDELQQVLANNPFAHGPGNRVVTIFLEQQLHDRALLEAVGQTGEKTAIGTREIYVWYGHEMGKSKLRIPAAKDGTARNMNTVAKLVDMMLATEAKGS
jgi:uncharacterized protein (DUF1697 family)